MKRNPSVLLGALCTALLLLSANHALAQANAKPPTQLTYQGFLTDANGVPFGNTTPVNKTVRFRIYDVLSGGTSANLKWSSEQVVTVDKGYFSVLLGQGSSVGSEPFSADLTGVFAGSSTASDRYLELQADGTTILPRLRFLPAPYAVLAKSATDLVDPVTGASSLSIAAGGLITGNGANLTSLNASQITSGTLANARTTATSSRFSNTLVSRDGVGNSYFGDNSTGGAGIGASSEGTELRLHGNGYHHFAFRNKLGDLNIGTSDIGESLGSPMTPFLTLGGNGNVGIGTTTPTSKLEVNGNVAATSFSGNGTIPLGGIIMWSGATNAIPAGWALCDGATVNGRTTPNLKDRFVIGAGGGYAVGATGGNSSYSLTVGNLPSFSINYQDIYHSENNGTVTVPSNKGSGDTDSDNRGYDMTRTATFNGSASAFSIIPPYYALAFIMRVQ